MVYFASFNDGEKYFTSEAPIEVTDASPLNFQVKIQPGEKILSQGVFKYEKTGAQYDIVRLTSTQFFLVDENGFMCSNSYGALANLDSFLKNTALPTVHQSRPLTFMVQDSINPGSILNGEKSIAISVSHIDGARVSFDVVYSVNNSIVGTRTFSFSSQARNVEIDGFKISFTPRTSNTIAVDSVVEPANLSAFAKTMFRR